MAETNIKTILIIDESTAHVAAMREMLRRRGFAVDDCSSCWEGLARAKREPPDLILLEQFAPQMDGLELLAALATGPQTSHIPVVILASQYQSTAKIRAFWRGAKEYLVKPVDEAELLYVVNFMTRDSVSEAPVTA